MNKLAILSIVGALATLWFISSSPSVDTAIDAKFQDFINQYGVNYAADSEYEFRRQVFAQNMKKAKELSQANPLARFGVTQFADRTAEEMMQRMGDKDVDAKPIGEFYTQTANSDKDSISWEKYFQPIQNQGSCGSCWAFAATATYEAYANIRGQDKTKYSEQELTDCVTSCSGCNGGLAMYAWQWLNGNKFCDEKEYGYVAKDESCDKTKATSSCSKAAITKSYQLVASDEAAILSKLESGPVAISIDASSWHLYEGGIMTEGCGINTNHAVVIVGYVNDGTNKYWVIRNSWGKDYGEKGHVWLAYGKNMCNIEKRPCYPTF